MWAWLTTLDEKHGMAELPAPLPPTICVPEYVPVNMFGPPDLCTPIWKVRTFVKVAPQAYVERQEH